MSKTYKKWSAEEELVISRMRKEGSTIRTIAVFLNRSEASVASRVRQMLDECKLEKLNAVQRMNEVKQKIKTPVVRKSKIDYEEIKKRIENGGIRNVQKTLREYSKETGISIHSLNNAYYSLSQTRTRIKDRVRTFTVVTPTCVLEGANKNTDKPVVKVSIWKKLKSLLSSLLYS
jgi:lambda repressor-like predicted transcriptional regulator